MAFRYFAAGTTFVTLVGAGTAINYKQYLIDQRRRELVTEQATYESKMQQLQADIQNAEVERTTAVNKVVARQEAFKVLWEDRLQRYHQANLDAASYLKALPEGLGVLKGLIHHYRYMSDELRHFIGFDLAASKVHNFSLLVSGLQEAHPLRAVRALKGLFAAEPLVQEVCSCSERFFADVQDVPATIQEVSQSFLFVLDALETSLKRSVDRYVASARAARSHHENVALDALWDIFAAAKFDLNDNHDAENILAAQREINHDRRRLWCEADVKEAVRYADKLLYRWGHNLPAQEVTNPAHHAHLTPPAMKLVMEYVSEDGEVRAAFQQLKAWQEGAVAFQVAAQTRVALASYQKLLAASLVEVAPETP